MEISSSAWPNLTFQSLFATNNDPEFKSFISKHKAKTNQEVIKLLTCLLSLVYAFTDSSYEKISVVVFTGVLLLVFAQQKMSTMFNYAAVLICIGLPWLRIFFISTKTALFNHVTCSITLLPIMMLTRSYLFSFISLIFIVIFNRYNSDNIISQITDSPDTCTEFFKYYMDNCQVIYLLVFGLSFFSTHYNTQALSQLWLKQKECSRLYNQLKTQNQSLEELKKSKTKLLLGLSHEFRNPINAAFGNLELANSRTNDLIVKEHLSNCKVSIEMLFHLVSNLLDSNKLEAGILELNPLQKSSRPMFYKVWEIVKNLLDKQNLLGEFYIHKKIPRMLNVDSHFVVKILLNLILNAIKYTNQGAVMTVITWINGNHMTNDMFEPSKGFYSKFLNMTIKKNRVATSLIERPTIVRTRSSRRYHTVGSVPADSGSDGIDEIEIPSEESGGMDEKMHLHAMTRNASIEVVETFHNLMKDYEKLTNRGGFPTDTAAHKFIFDNSTTHEAQPRKGFLKIEVYDSGIGMENNLIKDSLFQKFNSDPHNVDRRLGLGLGLWLTEGLCKFMGGQIRASSEKDKGSQFIAVLPMEVSESQQPQHILQALSPTRLAAVELRALVVDDDKYNREVNTAFLRKAGVIVAGEAANGDEAVKIFASKPTNYFDLITMDLEMPIMNGKEAAKNIRDIERLQGKPPVKIVIATGNCDLSEYTACMDGDGSIKADFFFRKPLFQKDVEGFVDVIRQEKALKMSYGS